eukprot:TRINITY_DN1509_c1_g1_i1.p1 TRINITY_DN1509_c1_g1~~TRINITY_DN1509_c1_g1_i1.p1  ORF type:complete len:667 (+),score=99.52 TRINITY_DN1509_c1_g1_i1:48-2048(+)
MSHVLTLEELTALVRSQGEELNSLKESLKSERKTVRALERFVAEIVLENKGSNVKLDDRFADIINPSVELMGGIDGDEAAIEVPVYKEVYEMAKEMKSDKLRKETARMLGSLMVKSELNRHNFDDIKFLEEDVKAIFSSTDFPLLINEDELWDKLELSYMSFGSSENGLPADVKQDLLRKLDLRMLSDSVARKLMDHLRHINWGPSIIDELKNQISIKPKRKYRFGPRAVVVTKADLSNDDTRSKLAAHFEKEPSAMCVLDVQEFLEGNALTVKVNLPFSVRHVTLIKGDSCTEIGDDFLSQLASLTTADLSSLKNVTRLGDNFLFQCSSLTSVNLSFFTNVESIGKGFLSECKLLTSIDLSAFQKVKCLNDQFLSECSSLRTIFNISSLRDVKSVGNNFLFRCSSLVSVDLSFFTQVESIGKSFLAECKLVETVDLSAFQKVTSVSDSFLCECVALKGISNITGLANVKSIGDDFLWKCVSLASVDLTVFTEVESIGKAFLFECGLLKTVDLSAFTKVTRINHYFLYMCSSLTEISNISSLKGVTDIGDNFLFRCDSIVSIDLSPFTKVVSIGKSFLARCRLLENIDLSAFKELKHVGEYFLGNCLALKSITNISSLKAVTTVGDYAMFQCKSLTPLDTAVPDWENLNEGLKKELERLKENKESK